MSNGYNDAMGKVLFGQKQEKTTKPKSETDIISKTTELAGKTQINIPGLLAGAGLSDIIKASGSPGAKYLRWGYHLFLPLSIQDPSFIPLWYSTALGDIAYRGATKLTDAPPLSRPVIELAKKAAASTEEMAKQAAREAIQRLFRKERGVKIEEPTPTDVRTLTEEELKWYKPSEEFAPPETPPSEQKPPAKEPVEEPKSSILYKRPTSKKEAQEGIKIIEEIPKTKGETDYKKAVENIISRSKEIDEKLASAVLELTKKPTKRKAIERVIGEFMKKDVEAKGGAETKKVTKIKSIKGGLRGAIRRIQKI